uniref:Uncharacterized protein n=2 Tax=unclassified Prevotella TaxID=2638335 RepID=A0AB33JTY3_9BACT
MLQSQDSTAAKALQFFKFEESESATGQKTPQRKETAQKKAHLCRHALHYLMVWFTFPEPATWYRGQSQSLHPSG